MTTNKYLRDGSYIFASDEDAVIRRFVANAANADEAEKIVSALNAASDRPSPASGDAGKCDWPDGVRFQVFKQGNPGAHTPWYVVMPGGSCLEFNHHANDAIDEARAKWVCDALNAALAGDRSSEGKGNG